MSTDDPCATCYGRKFVRSPDGRWSPCGACFWAVVSQTYIKPIIRQADTQIATKYAALEPWGLKDRVEVGLYDDFRGMVWQSLLHYYDRRLTYEYFEAWRLTEIQFGRDSEFESLRDFKDLDLLVLVSGIADPPNSYTLPLVKYVTELRKMHGKPTWVYARAKAPLERVPTSLEPAPPAPPADQPVPPPRRRLYEFGS